MSIFWQLWTTTTEVIELPPPYVQTHLGGTQQAEDPRAMPLAEFTAEVMALLRSKPGAPEVLVERVKGLRFAAERGGYDATFKGFNQRGHVRPALTPPRLLSAARGRMAPCARGSSWRRSSRSA